jgi:HK97 family phage prohead protease
MKKFNKGERAELISTIRSIDEQARTVDFIVSDTSVDRYNTVVNGWVLDHYVKNPVVLFGHDSGSLPIGRALSVNQVEGKLVAKLEFAPAEVYEFADQVFRLIKAGYLNAVSAGFIPDDVEYNDQAEAFELRNNELLEISVVPLPANRNALKKAVADGGLQLRGWQIADDDDAPIVLEEEPTLEARAALEAWCARSVENAPTDDVPVDDPVQPEPTEAERAFFAAHLVIRSICRDLGITPPDSPDQYPEASAAIVAAARAAGDPPAAVELLCPPAVQEGLDKILARLDEVESRLTTPAPAADTGTTRALRSIMERATRLAAEG